MQITVAWASTNKTKFKKLYNQIHAFRIIFDKKKLKQT